MSSSSILGNPAMRTRNGGERDCRRARFGTIEELERRELLSTLICDGPAGAWAGENSDLPFKRWCPDLQFSSPSSLAVADFNNDSTLDLAVGTDDPTQNLSVLISRGDGTFASMRRTGEPGRAVSIGAEDFDRDGLADLIEANETTEFVSVYRQRPDGSFEGPFGGGFNNVRAVVPGDVLSCGPQGQVTIAHDYDAGSPNGLIRVTCVNNLYPGGMVFDPRPKQAEVLPGPRALVAGDFYPGQGRAEVLVVNGPDSVQIVGSFNGNDVSASQPIPVRGPLTATAADFDSDGRLDAAVATGQSVAILLNQGELTQHADLQGIGTRAIASADLNADGHADLIAAGWQYQLVGDESGYDFRSSSCLPVIARTPASWGLVGCSRSRALASSSWMSAVASSVSPACT